MTNLQKIREQREMSKYRLAQLTGFSITYISNIEGGKRSIEDISLRNIKTFANALNVDYTDLLD